MLAVTKPVEAALRVRCDAWHLRLDKMSFNRGVGPEAKTSALQTLSRTYAASLDRYLRSAAISRSSFLEALHRQHGARYREVALTLESRLLLHLGRASVLENVGLHADRTTGLPLVPGTALKGVISTWTCWEANQRPDGSFNEGNAFDQQRRELARRILGDDSPTGSEHVGEVIFVGGFPSSPPRLGLDITNPHYDEEIDRHTREVRVRDKTRLTPNAFLCVEPGTTWRFAFFARPGSADPFVLLETTARWVTEALSQAGIGAKTAAGYGRFRSSDQPKPVSTGTAAPAGDFTDKAFSSVLARMNHPGQAQLFQKDVALIKEPRNAAWLARLKQELASPVGKDARKRLRGKDWFPQDWLPPQ